MNKNPSPVGYKPFRVSPVLQDGLLAVDRPDGGPERRVAEAFARAAATADQIADAYAEKEGREAGLRDALANGPRPSEISGGVTTTTTGGAPMAYAASGQSLPAPATGGKDLDERGRYIYQGLRQRGLSHVAAAASVGHGRQESSLNAAGPDGDSGTSSGIWQWRNERRTALQSFAQSRGANWRDVDTQMDFFVHELKTSPGERLAWNRLQAATDYTSAAEALMHFERPRGYTARTPRAGHGWDNRLANTLWAASFGEGYEPAAPTATALAPTPAPTGAAAAIETIAPTQTASQPKAADAPAATSVAPESVGPPTVTRVVEPASIRSGGAGGFRPTGSMTIRGRAYDAAGMRTYLEQLDTTIRTDVDAVYSKFKDDPAALDNAFQALRTVHMQDHVFPEVAADYDKAFQHVTQPYRHLARENLDQRRKQADRAEFLNRNAELETITARTVAGFDPTRDDAAEAIASSQQARDAHFDSAVARGILDPDDAAKAKLASRRQTAVSFYGRQAELLKTPEEVAALKETMRKDFASGGLAGIDGAGWAELDAALDRTRAEKQRIGSEADRTLKARGDSIAERVAAGIEVDSAEMGRFMLDRKTAPKGAAIVNETMEKVSAARILRDKPLNEAETYVLGLERDASAVSNGTADFARAELERMKTAARENPVGLAERKGLLPPEDGSLMDAQSPDDLIGRVKLRVERAELAAEHFGVTPKYLKPGEAAAIRAMVEQNPAGAAALAAGLVRGAGPSVGSILVELKDDAPAIAQAGVILAGGGSPKAAADVIDGYGKGADGKNHPDFLKEPMKKFVVTQTFGQAYAGSPADATRAIATAEAITKARIAKAGIDPKSEAVVGIYERALQEATGAVFDGDVQYGGITKLKISNGYLGGRTTGNRKDVIVPPTIRADRFVDVIDAIRDSDLLATGESRSRVGKPYFSAPPRRENGKAYSAADIKAATPVAVYGGYRFAMGDPTSDDPQWIQGADGRPFVLAIGAMKPILEARVPGAFR
ncbi:phage tail tip lysozyme [Aureimonas ureilytica]|nr:phage tail tip lysozyme [Aureimonas ureilytica]